MRAHVSSVSRTPAHELSHKYLGIGIAGEKGDEVRVIIRVVPRKIVDCSA
ncbi:hypothetical protein [Streptomyces colonosanans]|nr:hypothetical protein [Streptomyces colonosanans]